MALFALLVQFVLSFGHLHATDVWGPAGFRIGHDAGPVRVTDNDHRRGDPGSQDADLAEDGCSICASVAALGTAVLPDPVKPRLPPLANGRNAPERAPPLSGAAPSLPFQPRAPPQA